MATSAFAAVSHLEHPDTDATNDADRHRNQAQAPPAAETEKEAAQRAADPSIEHSVDQAASIDKSGAGHPDIDTAGSPPRQSESASALPDSSTPFEPGSVATPAPTVAPPAEAQPATAAKVSRQDSQPSRAGSSPSSQTFDPALHQGISELVKAPDSAAHTSQGPAGMAVCSSHPVNSCVVALDHEMHTNKVMLDLPSEPQTGEALCEQLSAVHCRPGVTHGQAKHCACPSGLMCKCVCDKSPETHCVWRCSAGLITPYLQLKVLALPHLLWTVTRTTWQ